MENGLYYITLLTVLVIILSRERFPESRTRLGVALNKVRTPRVFSEQPYSPSPV
jgi:hypothetical protein